MIKQITFSPTGGTKKVADAVSEGIDINNVKKADKAKCISCMKCISVCPRSARKIGSVMHFAIKTMLKKPCSERKANELFV